jgi:hypothetical protein
MILSIISPHKLADVAGNLMLMILPSHWDWPKASLSGGFIGIK